MSATGENIVADVNAVPPQMALMQLASGYWVSQAIYVAAKLGLADLLKDGPKTPEELAGPSGAHARTLYRVLRALASVGVFEEDEAGRFRMTPLAEPLTSGPGSMRAMVIHLCEPASWAAWGELLHSVRTGENAFKHTHGAEPFDYYLSHPESMEPFNEAMTNFSRVVIPALVGAYDFSKLGKLVDVGGGHGSLLAAVLKANPDLKGVLFDLAPAAEGARRLIGEEGLADRCEVVAGDFFESVPEGGDAYMMKHIIHDWEDERALKILKNCHGVMKEGGRVLILESVVPAGNDPAPSKFMDLNMLVLPGGQERTADEYRELLAAAGFRMTGITPTQSPVSIIEGEK